MTTAGGMGPGGTGMNFGDDYVAARLSIDIPEGSVEGITQITQAVDKFRISLEAAGRVEGDFSRYLEDMTQAGKAADQYMKNLVDTLRSYMSLTNRYGGAPPSGVPGGRMQQPFSGQISGMGHPSEPVRPPNPTDVAAQLEQQARQGDPGDAINFHHPRGGLTAQDVINISPTSIKGIAEALADRMGAERKEQAQTRAADPDSTERERQDASLPLAQRIQKGSSVAQRVMNEVGPGGSPAGLGGLAIQGLQWAGRKSAQVAGRAPTTARAPTSGPSPTEGDPGSPGMGSDADTAAGAEIPVAPSGGGGMLSMLPMLGKTLFGVGAAVTAAVGVFEGIQKGGSMIQGMRNVASMRGGAAGEGAQVEWKAKMMATNPYITQDQARQIYQTVMSEGYADAGGAGADNVIDFMSQNMQHMNISVADSAKMLRSTIVGKGGEGDKDSVAGSIAMLRTELDSIRNISAKGAISTPDYTKGVMATQEALTAAGASPEAAASTAMGAEEVGAGNQAFKDQFRLGVTDLGTSGGGGALLRSFGGEGGGPLTAIPPGLPPQLTGAWLTQHGGLNQAVWNTLRHFAQMYARSENGSEEGHWRAVWMFQNMVKRIAPDMKASSDFHAAETLYMQLLENSEIGAATQRAGEQPSLGGNQGANTTVPQLPEASFSPSAAPQISAPASANRGNAGSQGSGPGGGNTQVSGSANVQIGLTPEAAKLLTVSGNSNQKIPLTPTQQASNRGVSGASLNQPQVGE